MNNSDNSNQPVYPSTGYLHDEALHNNPYYVNPSRGITKREHFASIALQGILANPNQHPGIGGFEEYANIAIKCADELLKQLDAKAH